MRVWPSVVAHVLDLHQSGHAPFGDRYHGDYTLASLIPRAAGEVTFLYREFSGTPIVWWQPLSLQDTIEQWLPLAEGDPTCVDQLISFIAPTAAGGSCARRPAVDPKARPGRPRQGREPHLPAIDMASRDPSARIERAELLFDWQRIVDALVVADVTRLAPYSE